jgi:polyhydroxyalkanoate synthesis regulator phasin
MIIDATAKGDAYRDSVKHLNQWVDETVESGIMTKDEAIKVISPEMQRIYNNHFK